MVRRPGFTFGGSPVSLGRRGGEGGNIEHRDESRRQPIAWHRISAAIGSSLFARIAVIGVLLGSIAYLAIKGHIATAMDDGDQFWYAGWLWNHGISPYGDTFLRLHKLALPKGAPPFFIYPLHFWVIGGPNTSLDFLHTLGSWADFPLNRLSSMTGAGNLVSLGLEIELSKQLLVFAAAAFACVLILIYGRADERDRLFLGATIAAAALFAPLHLYDLFFVLAIPFILLPPRTWCGAAVLMIGLMLVLRPENLARPLGLINWTVATIGALLVILIPLIERRLTRSAA